MSRSAAHPGVRAEAQRPSRSNGAGRRAAAMSGRVVSAGNDSDGLLFQRTLHGKVHFARDLGEQRVIATEAHTVARVVLCAALTDDDLAGVDRFAAVALDAEPFSLGVAAIA